MIVLITLGILAGLIILGALAVNFLTQWLWFDQLGFLSVLTTEWLWGVGMFAVGLIGFAAPLAISIEVVFRNRTGLTKLPAELSQFEPVIEKLAGAFRVLIPLLFGFAGAVFASNDWQAVALWWNGVPTGTVDPQFGLDNGFYLFSLPFYVGLASYALTVLCFSLVAAVVTGYLTGGISLTSNLRLRLTKAMRVQISLTLAVISLVIATVIFLQRYATVTSDSGRWTGAMYTDVHALIPGLTVLAIMAVLVAGLFVFTAIRGRWRYAGIGVATLALAAVVAGWAYPALVQQFQVNPSERDLESSYINRNISATRDAYGVDGVNVEDYSATTDAQPGALKEYAETTASIRLLDPNIVSPAFQQLQQFRQYYSFNSELDVDRYTINGTEHDTVIGVREINLKGLNESSWVNDHIVYTHGYGVVAAYGNQTTNGLPSFFESGIPSTGALSIDQPQIYFGESSPDYSIVGSAAGTAPVEMDYPSGTAGTAAQYTTFTGNGGPKLDSLFKRVLYAAKFGSSEILFSNSVTNDSQILYDRDPATRVEKVAPYLTIDSDPYPAVVDGRVVWIIDGYTTSSSYPYSQSESYSSVISDTRTKTTSLDLDKINYIRNSVKATVDAYTGQVTLYAWDETDPVLQAWQKVYPTTLKSVSDMSADLMSHVRYPSDLFKAQRQILATYHVTDAGAFYSEEDAWQTPTDPVAGSSSTLKQSPYYLSMQMPNETSASFSIYSTYIPINSSTGSSRNVLMGYLAANSNAGSTAGVKSASYGQLTLLSLPRDTTVEGPGQVQNRFNTDTTVSPQLNLLNQGGSQVLKGNLLTLPVGGGLLYVQPVYVQSSGETSYPILQKVLVAFGDKIAFEDTLDKALNSLFGDSSSGSGGSGGSGGSSSGGSGSTGGSDTSTNSALNAALQAAKQALQDSQTALQNGDWTAYGQAQAALQQAISAALAAQNAAASSGN